MGGKLLKSRLGSQSEGQWYEVLARRTPKEFLTHLGSVEAANEELAKARAIKIYDEHDWIEFCIFPRASSILLIPHRSHGEIGVC